MAALVFVPAAGQAASWQDWQFNGFGTLGGVYHHEDGIEYRRDVTQPHGAQSGKLDLSTDSSLGGQLSGPLTDKLSATLQLVSKLNDSNNWNPRPTWAFLKYQFEGDSSVRVGRLLLDLQMRSDSNGIGYANTPIRPALEMYGNIRPEVYDGVDVTLVRPLGQGLGRFKLMAGDLYGDLTLAPGAVLDMRHKPFISGYLEYQQGPWTGRFSARHLAMGDATGAAELREVLRQAGAADAAAVLDSANQTINFYGLGVAYDEGNLQGSAQYSVWGYNTRLGGPDTHSLLLESSYRLGDLQPYVAASWAWSKRDYVATGLAADNPLNQVALAVQQGFFSNQFSFTLGSRYELTPQLAVKAQVDYLDVKDPIVLLETAPSPSRRRFNVYSLSLDFVF
ncbi:hypothetical protein C4K68_11335 [Pokkaliibacter plantistimulans]|uniref:Porin n=1 Tax=Proteobacteria bacterium 228 TaxID=2083153 RepID=A0A2S5KQ95_9PROT|nr:hypothetical protein [Pokkaliibacter plantistimulans]PPC77014.1 hypothetical protein C4K68_11335 [Pokkaliibacter plantistimulans]